MLFSMELLGPAPLLTIFVKMPADESITLARLLPPDTQY